MPTSVFTTIDGKAYIQVDGYFSSDMMKKIPLPESEGYVYLVEHVVEPQSIVGKSRAYYKRASVGLVDPTLIDAILTSTNFVKKVKLNSSRQ